MVKGMNKLLLAGFICIAIWVLIILRHPSNSGFSDEDIRQCEQTIKESYLNRLKNSSSETERREAETGATTVDVQMIKVADRKLEGYVKISINTPEAKDIGMGEIMHKCEAKMEMNSSRYIWQCNTAQ
jgi:hypothetical protein